MAKIEFEKYEFNPIIAPTKNWWETRATFNAGVAEYQNKIIILYRAIGNDGISRLGYAESENGKKISKRLDYPVIEPTLDDSFERLGIEDPRITKLGTTYWITCVAASLYEATFISSLIDHLGRSHRHYAPWRVKASLFKTRDFQHYKKVGRVFGDEDNKDVVIFPEKIKGKYVILDRLLPDITLAWADKIEGKWSERETVMKPKEGWQEGRIGVAAAPIKTKKGWLIIYHAADKKRVYRLGFALLDLNNPAKVIYRHPDPVLQPEKKYETRGWASNVVFCCGMIEKGDEFYLYYGGADKVIGLATIKKEKLLNVLL
jgi:predicted GH43/DUF377 family glycosyl hydrolase